MGLHAQAAKRLGHAGLGISDLPQVSKNVMRGTGLVMIVPRSISVGQRSRPGENTKGQPNNGDD